MSYRADNLVTEGLTDGRTDAGNDNTRRPKLASGKNEPQVRHIHWIFAFSIVFQHLDGAVKQST